MTETNDTKRERVVDHYEEYREHYIRVQVYRFGDGASTDKEATVSVHENRPTASPIGKAVLPITTKKTDRSASKSWTIDIPTHDSEDVLEDAIEQAKGWVETQAGDRYGARESTATAFERAGLRGEGSSGDQ